MLASAAPNIFYVIVLPIISMGVVGGVSIGVYKVLGGVFRG